MSLHQFALGAASASASAAAAAAKRRKLNSSVCSLNGLATASGDTSTNKTMETSDGDGSDSDSDEELLVVDAPHTPLLDNNEPVKRNDSEQKRKQKRPLLRRTCLFELQYMSGHHIQKKMKLRE